MDVWTTQTLVPLMMWLMVGCLSGGCGAAMEGDEGDEGDEGEPVLATPGWVRVRGVAGAGRCFGYDFQDRCIANPPGYDPALGFTPLTGESYD